MINHEDLNLKKSHKLQEDVMQTNSAGILADGEEIVQRPLPKEMEDSEMMRGAIDSISSKLKSLDKKKRRNQKIQEEAKLLAESLEHTASKTKKAHTQQLARILNEAERTEGNRNLVIIPTQTALLSGMGESFNERLDPNERARKIINKKSELYQKDKNARMVEVAEDNYARKCHAAMRMSMESRAVKCEDKQVYSDLSQFIAASDKELTQADKTMLLDCYLGKSLNNGPEGLEGQDKQKAMDIMTKAIMAIDVSSIRIDSDAYLARNSEMLEGVSCKVAAYHRMLKRYGESEAYFGNLEGTLPKIIRDQLDRLSLISYYYQSRKDIIKDKYFREHYNDEVSMHTDENAPDEQKKLAKKLTESVNLCDKLRAAFGEKGQRRSFRLSERQRNKLEMTLADMDYLRIGEDDYYSSKAIKCDKTFEGLKLSFNELGDNGRFFGVNSPLMKTVKEHIQEVSDLLKKSLSDFAGRDARFELMYALSELKRVCTDYRDEKITGRGENRRHDSVLDILEYSGRCMDFLSYLSEDDFANLTDEKYDKPLEDIFSGSGLIADKSETKMKKTMDSYFRQLHYDKVQDAFFKNFDEVSDFHPAGATLKAIGNIFDGQVADNQEDFYKVKRDLENRYKRIISYGKDYISSKISYFSSSRHRQDKAGEVISYANQMLERIKDLSFENLKTQNIKSLKWSDIVFGGMLETFKEGAGTTANKRVDRVFVNLDADKKKYKEIQAAKFVLGDGSMLTNYRPARMICRDGSVISGLCYSNPKNRIIGHSHQEFEEMSAKTIREAAENEGVRIIYSENAVRQLTNIRIMDTLFGRKTRNLDSLKYNASTQIVFGEPRIVISSVSTNDIDFFQRKDAGEEIGERVKKVSVLDADGKLNIGAYDRKVADRIMSMSAAECLTEFEKIGITMTQNERESFEKNYNSLKRAFEADLKDENSWRFKQDAEDEEKRQNDIENTNNLLKKYKRWNLKDDDWLVKKAKKKLNDLSFKMVRDKNDMYTDNADSRIEKGIDPGLMDTLLLDKNIKVDKDLTLQMEEAKQQEENIQVLTGRAKLLREREQNARKKILKIRQEKDAFISKSDDLRLKEKDRIKSGAKKLKKSGQEKKVSAEFINIMDCVIQYSEMNVTVKNCLSKSQVDDRPVFNPQPYENEAQTINTILSNIDKRLNILPQDPTEESEKFEVHNLRNIKNYFTTNKNGKLIVPAGSKIIKVKDDRFVDLDVDETTNEAKIHGVEFNDKRNVNMPLFTHEPCVNDIAQGRLGDCYFLSTMAALVEKNPDIIKNMIKDNGDGSVTVRFYDGEKPIYVTVEKTVPKNNEEENENRGGDKYVRGALWAQMIEKAYAASGLAVKVKGLDNSEDKSDMDQLEVSRKLEYEQFVAYKMIRGGNAGDATEIFTGKNSKTYYFDENDERFEGQLKKGTLVYSNKQEDFLRYARTLTSNSRYVLMVGSVVEHSTGQDTGFSGDAAFKGVATTHAYTVMGIRVIDGQEVVVLRNPWGYGATKERYSKNTSVVSSTLDRNYSSGGYLFLPVDMFFRTFRRFHLGYT